MKRPSPYFVGEGPVPSRRTRRYQRDVRLSSADDGRARSLPYTDWHRASVSRAGDTLFASAFRPQPIFAHPLGNFTVNQYSRIEATTDGLRLVYVLDMAEIPAFQEIHDSTRTAMAISRSPERDLSCDQFPRSPVPSTYRAMHRTFPDDMNVTFPDGQAGLKLLRLRAVFVPTYLSSQSRPLQMSYQNEFDADRLGWKEILVTNGEGIAVNGAASPLPISAMNFAPIPKISSKPARPDRASPSDSPCNPAHRPHPNSPDSPPVNRRPRPWRDRPPRRWHDRRPLRFTPERRRPDQVADHRRPTPGRRLGRHTHSLPVTAKPSSAPTSSVPVVPPARCLSRTDRDDHPYRRGPWARPGDPLRLPVHPPGGSFPLDERLFRRLVVAMGLFTLRQRLRGEPGFGHHHHDHDHDHSHDHARPPA